MGKLTHTTRNVYIVKQLHMKITIRSSCSKIQPIQLNIRLSYKFNKTVAASPLLAYFFKTLFKVNIFAVWRVRDKRGKFDFDHHFAFLTNFLTRQNFLLSDILFGSSRGSFSKKIVQNGPSLQIL